MYQRHLEEGLQGATRRSPAVLLTGARQTGKTTLVRQLADRLKSSTYWSLDEPLPAALLTNDPITALSNLPGTVILDEIQLMPELFKALKVVIDRNRQPGKFLLTGSANVLLLPKVSESLAGRMEVHTMYPLSQGEIIGHRERFVDLVFASVAMFRRGFQNLQQHQVPQRKELLERCLIGGYPEVLSRRTGQDKSAWFDSYVKMVTLKDIRELVDLSGMAIIPSLTQLLAARSCSLINYADLGRGLAVNQVTLKRYVTWLERLYLIGFAPAWSTNIGQRVIKSPKLFFGDSGILAHILGMNLNRLAVDTMLSGVLLENFVYNELQKQITWSKLRPSLHHFRTAQGHEVDFVLEEPTGRVVGIEVKAGESIGAHDLKGMRALAESAGKRFHRGLVLYSGKQFSEFAPGMFLLPVSSLWQA